MPRKNEPFLGLGYGWNTGENGWGSGYNEAIKTLSVLCNGGVETIQNDPVASPVVGKAYVVGTVPTGLWAGKANHITYWDTDSTSWIFIPPRVGLNVLVKAQGNSGEWYYYGTGNTWVRSATYTGVVLDGGECDLSGGVYPQPIMDGGVKCSTVWYIKVGGSVDGISYDSGDQLRYTTANGGFYFRIDSRDEVVSVQGEKGAVILTPEKIGADPVGTAQSAVAQHKQESNAHTPERVGADPAGTAASAIATLKKEPDPFPQYTTDSEVVDLIGASAVPFPDVWIPFNDSLRMFAGYGREVKVGDDVVARMVNFERSTTATYIDKSGVLRTAAINEPRFEKQGLLIEGQSSNIVKFSSNRVWANGFSAGATLSLVDSTDPMTSSLCPKILRVGSEARYGVYLPPEIISPVTVGTVYTLTMRMRRLDAELGAISINSASGVKNSANSPAGVWTTRTITFTADATTVWPTPPQGEYEYAFIQLEALPFASSYIPTNGAAVTRAADKCRIPAAGNIPLNLNSMTQSASIDILGKGLSSWPRLVELNHPVDRGALVSMVDGTWGGASLPVSITGNSMISTVAVARYEDGKLFNDGRAGTTFSRYQSIDAGGIVYIAGYPAVATRWFFGHIKNLRIWHHALSDAQIRGIK